MVMTIVTAGGDFSYRDAKMINNNFQEVDDKLLGWEDLRFPASAINPAGQTGAATLDTSGVYAGTLLFSPSVINVVVGQAQFPHSKKYDTEIVPHVHWTPTATGAGDVLWRFEYILADIHGVFPGTYTVLNKLATSSETVGYHELTLFDPIDTTGYHVSAMMVWKLSRVANDATDTLASNARLLEFDIHYQVDEVGSATVSSK